MKKIITTLLLICCALASHATPPGDATDILRQKLTAKLHLNEAQLLRLTPFIKRYVENSGAEKEVALNNLTSAVKELTGQQPDMASL